MDKYLVGLRYEFINNLDEIPKDKLTEEIYLEAIKQKKCELKHVPQKFRNEAIYLAAVQQTGALLAVIPKEQLTQQMCLMAVENACWVLEYVPNHLQTEEMYLIAVKQDKEILDIIPEEKRTEAIYLAAVQQDGDLLEAIPEEKRTEKICLAAVEQNGWALGYIREEDRTEELCLAAVKQDEAVLDIISEEQRTEAIYIEALRANVKLVNEMPMEKRTEAVYMAAINCDWEAINIVPKNKRTEEMYLKAVKQSARALNYVPREKRTEAIYLEALRNDMDLIDHVSEKIVKKYLEELKLKYKLNYVPTRAEAINIKKLCEPYGALTYILYSERTEAVCTVAVQLDGAALQYVPKDKKTKEICLTAVQKDGYALQYVPEDKITEEMCLIAVQKDGCVLPCVPEDKMAEEICMIAVEQNYRALQYVPEDKKTKEICMAAIKQNGSMIVRVPQEMRTDDMYIEALRTNRSVAMISKPKIKFIKEACRHTNPDITDEEVIEVCKIAFPEVLIQEGKEEIIIEAVREKIGDNEVEITTLERLQTLIDNNKEYYEILINEFWRVISGKSNLLKNEAFGFSMYALDLLNMAEKFLEELGYAPAPDVVMNWHNPINEYDDKEYKKLLEAGIIKKSNEYREEEHKTWILKMYQVFGYENTLKLLDNIPEITEDMLEDLISENAKATQEIFEKKYILTGEIALSVELINKINNLAGKDSQKVFAEINKTLESENKTVSIKEILVKYGFDERTIDKIEGEINLQINREKIEKIEESLRNVIDENITHQQGRIYDLIQKVIKHQIQENKGITEENLLNEVLKELNRKDETEEYIYSPVIRSEQKHIEETVKQFMAQNGIEKILNNNIIKILKRSKEKIGQGWIRKIIGIPQEMTKEEYEIACGKLGVELEHIEEIKLRAKDDKTKQEAMELLQKIKCPEIITFEKLEVMFGGLNSPYSKEFGKYFMEHKEEIMTNPEYMQNFSKMHNKFDEIIKNPNIRLAYERGNLQVKTVLEIALDINYDYEKGEKELATRAKEAQLEKMYWENAQEVFKITRQREESTIPPVKAEGKKYRGRMLRVDDPLQLFVGDMTGCCQRFGNVGEGAMLHGVTEKNGGIFVIEQIDEKGNSVKLVAQSWTWRNDDIMCFDNIEVKGDSLTHEEQEEVLRIYKESAEQAIKMDSEILEQMYKNGKITKEQYEYYTLKEVRIGLGYNQGMRIMEEKITSGEVEKSYDTIKPKESDKVYDLGTEDRTPWVDSEMSIIIARNEKLARREKPKDMKGELISYRKSRKIIEVKGYEIDGDIVDRMKQIESETYREEQQIMQECETIEDIAYEYNCYPEELRVSISENNDWYAMYYEQGESIYIADIALVNGTNAEKNSERKTEVLISSIELAKKMYEIFIEAAKTGKTITCDATKDTSGLNIDTMIKNGLVKVVKDKEYDWNYDSDIQMRSMTLIPNEEKLMKELKKLEKLLNKAEQRRISRKGVERG